MVVVTKAVKQDSRMQIGFSMVELLVVIAIIGLLAALLLAALSNAKAHAHSTTCKSHLHQMGLALQMYVDENHGKYPYYRGLLDSAYDDAVGSSNAGFWWAKLSPYYPVKWNDPAYHCPGYKGAVKGSLVDRRGWSNPLGSYAYNAKGVKAGSWMATNDLTLGLGGRMSYPSQPGRLGGVPSEGQIAVPSEMLAIGESRWRKQGGQSEEGGKDYMQCGLLGNNRGVGAFDPARHGRNYNQLFCDGHVSGMNPFALFNPTNSAPMWNYDHLPHSEFWSSY